MKELMSAENLTEAISTIKVLNERIVALQKDVATWKITFSVNVEKDENDEFYAEVVARVGDHGLRQVLSQEQLVNFADDPSTLARDIAETMLHELMNNEATNALLKQLAPATKNVALLANKRGFAK